MMDTQELRGEIREELSNTLAHARAIDNDEYLLTYLHGKAAALRGVLALLSRGE
jgi:hypothetical protein